MHCNLCGRKALTLLSSVFAVCSLGLLGIAVSTDYCTEIRMSLHSGLWRVCFLAGAEKGRCFTIEYVMPMNVQMTSESTASVLKMIRSATPFPLVHTHREHTPGAVGSHIAAALRGAVGGVVPCSRVSPQSSGVMSVYLFMKRYTAEEMYRPHPGFYRPRLSNCSDYSGQFLHPDAWARGRSPSDISSEASLQMNSNYPALLKCPDYDQMSSSPC
uniref:Calcium channel, voltage-dependent, gamma subunit 5a n=1 Tax=Sinocyclocheilus anshuiensis TaxID=1608454 RepID=A0A671M1T1_9TELE